QYQYPRTAGEGSFKGEKSGYVPNHRYERLGGLRTVSVERRRHMACAVGAKAERRSGVSRKGRNHKRRRYRLSNHARVALFADGVTGIFTGPGPGFYRL